MAISEHDNPKDYQENDDDFEEEEESESSCNGESDSDDDPSYGIVDVEEASARFSNLSVKKSRSRTRNAKNLEETDIDLPEEDQKSYEKVQKIVRAGQLEKLKVDQCKVYLRKNGLRLSGNKDSLIQRIREHLEILDGEGEKKYPPPSFVLNCKGDACTGDIVMFEQNVYDMYNIASRSAGGPPSGKRIVAGRIVKESYGAAKQQHTFTMEVLWSKGDKPLPALHPLLVKGRNLYRLKTLRQRWKDEGARQKVLMEKHSRGSLARSDREERIQEKERRRNLKKNKIARKEEPNKSQSLLKAKVGSQFQKSGPSFPRPSATEIQKPESFICSEKPTRPLQLLGLSNRSGKEANKQPAVQLRQADVLLASRKPAVQHTHQPGFTVQPGFQPQNWNAHQLQTSSRNQLFQNPVKSSSIRQARLQNQDDFHPNYIQNDCSNIRKYRSPTDNHPEPDICMKKFPRMDYSRLPLTNLNPCPQPSRPQTQVYPQLQRQPCQYFAQGRCYFGDSCKFSHEPSYVQEKRARWCEYY